MSSDSRDKKQRDAFDALDALAGGGDSALAPETPPAKKAPKPAPKQPAAPPASDAEVEIPKVPKRPTQPPAGSGRPDTPPAVKKAPKATPVRAVAPPAAGAAPAPAKPAAATPKPGQRTRRIDPAKLKRRIAGMKQAEGWRQTAFPILMTIGLLLVGLGIVGLITMPSKSFDPKADTDNWDTDPNSPMGRPAIRFMTYAAFPVGAVVILGGILLVVQAMKLKKMWQADELILNPPEELE